MMDGDRYPPCFPTVDLKRPYPLRCDKDQKSHKTADQRSVNADVLQILADLQFQPVDQRRGVPVVNDALSSDLGTIEQQKSQCNSKDTAIK